MEVSTTRPRSEQRGRRRGVAWRGVGGGELGGAAAGRGRVSRHWCKARGRLMQPDAAGSAESAMTSIAALPQQVPVRSDTAYFERNQSVRPRAPHSTPRIEYTNTQQAGRKGPAKTQPKGPKHQRALFHVPRQEEDSPQDRVVVFILVYVGSVGCGDGGGEGREGEGEEGGGVDKHIFCHSRAAAEAKE